MMLAFATATLLCVPVVEQLGHGHFRIREAAHGQLRRANWLAMAALQRGAAHPEAEVQVRCQQLLALLHEQWVQRTLRTLTATGYPRLPHIAYLVDVYPAWWEERARLDPQARAWPATCACTHYPDCRRATYLWCEWKLRSGTPLAAVQADLDRMLQLELDWVRSDGPHLNPPFRPLK